MKRALLVSALVVAGCSETSAGGFVTRTGVRVVPVNDMVFEVGARPGETMNADFWCGAGDYARRVLGAGDRDRVYVVSEAGQGAVIQGNSTAQFSLSPPAQTQGALGNVSHWGPKIGNQTTVVEARLKCRTHRSENN
ncbi:hypothetical protein [Shimia sp.]|uniref:hypothetical protein n=1 Tax=Shimia sp. TaxID=1954381 RepID=UPI0032979367